jgi:DNA polymerase I
MRAGWRSSNGLQPVGTLPKNLTARFTPGTLISSYEVFEALRRGIAVPFRKRDAESIRNISELKASDKGGMIFQPEPGVYEKVHQIDFTSLYPSIIVKYNLSPETLEHPERRGFLSTVLSSLLNLRIETKRLKKTNKEYAGIDSILKWMLVTCFGYTKVWAKNWDAYTGNLYNAKDSGVFEVT